MVPSTLVTENQRTVGTLRVARLLGWSVLSVLLVAGIFTLPSLPAHDLEASWRMALGYFFEHHLQLGREVVFTYGLLGFAAGNIFGGSQLWILIGSQLALAVVAAVTILRLGRRLRGASRLFFFAFFLLFGITNGDVLRVLVIAMLGFSLLRLTEQSRHRLIGLIGLVLAGYAQIKFTDLLLATFVVLVALMYQMVLSRGRAAAWLVCSFVGAFLGIWIACGQSLLNLPAYFYYSWQISEGYQWAMSLPTPVESLWKALVLLAVIAGYAGLHLCYNPNKPRAVANVLVLGAFTFLQWKHGFVRSDVHMSGFFFCVLLTLTAYPALLDDPDVLSRTHRTVFLGAIALSVWGVNDVQRDLWRSMPGIVGAGQDIINWTETRRRYGDQLAGDRRDCDLPLTRRIVGHSSLDMLGYEQGVALLNGFNYQPRPVFQSYYAYTPVLTEINRDFFASGRAPDYVLMKVHSIDGRFPAVDDAFVLPLFAYRYQYVHTENGFTLWRLRPGPSAPRSLAPEPLLSTKLELNRSLSVEDLTGRALWLKVELRPSLLGSIRHFLYKMPQVILSVDDEAGRTHEWPLPLPQGRGGFLVSPLIEDQIDLRHFASHLIGKRVRSVRLKVIPADLKFFASSAQVEFSALPWPAAGSPISSEIYQE